MHNISQTELGRSKNGAITYGLKKTLAVKFLLDDNEAIYAIPSGATNALITSITPVDVVDDTNNKNNSIVSAKVNGIECEEIRIVGSRMLDFTNGSTFFHIKKASDDDNVSALVEFRY